MRAGRSVIRRVSKLVSLTSPTYCAQKIEPTGRIGDALTRNFADAKNGAVLFSEVLPLTQHDETPRT